MILSKTSVAIRPVPARICRDGPNNSGKSNLLEFFHILLAACFDGIGSLEVVLGGYASRLSGSSIPRIAGLAKRPLKLGLSFQTTVNGTSWVAHYDLALRRDREDVEAAGFINEVLRAKNPSKTGKPKTYIRHEGRSLRILGKEKEYAIGDHTPSLSATGILSPGFEELHPEFAHILSGIRQTALTSVYALSPNGLRNAMHGETLKAVTRIPSFDLLKAIAEIWQDKERCELFKDTVCDILDMQDLAFEVQEKPDPGGRSEVSDRSEPLRFCYLKGASGRYAELEEFSDGTLIVVAIVAATYAENRSSPLMVVEEIENSLHPAALQKLLRFLQTEVDRLPVLMTAHSPYLLNGVKPEDVIVAVTDDTGATQFKKPGDRKAISKLLQSGFMSFGDLLVNNFQDVLGGP